MEETAMEEAATTTQAQPWYAGLDLTRPNSIRELVAYYRQLEQLSSGEGAALVKRERQHIVNMALGWFTDNPSKFIKEGNWVDAIHLLSLRDNRIAEAWLMQLHGRWQAEGGFNMKPWVHQALIMTLQRLPQTCPDALTSGGACAFLRDLLGWIRGAEYLTGTIADAHAWDAVLEVITLLSTHYNKGVGNALFEEFLKLEKTFNFNLKQQEESADESAEFLKQLKEQLQAAPKEIAALERKIEELSQEKEEADQKAQKYRALGVKSGFFKRVRTVVRENIAGKYPEKYEARVQDCEQTIAEYQARIKAMRQLAQQVETAEAGSEETETQLKRYKAVARALVVSRGMLKIEGTRLQDWETKFGLVQSVYDTGANVVGAGASVAVGVAGTAGAVAAAVGTGGISAAVGVGTSAMGLGASLRSAASQLGSAAMSGMNSALQAYYLFRKADTHPVAGLGGPSQVVFDLVLKLKQKVLHVSTGALLDETTPEDCLRIIQYLQGLLIGGGMASENISQDTVEALSQVLHAMFHRHALGGHRLDTMICDEVIALNQSLMCYGWPMLGAATLRSEQLLDPSFDAAQQLTAYEQSDAAQQGERWLSGYGSEKKNGKAKQAIARGIAHYQQLLKQRPVEETIQLPWYDWFDRDEMIDEFGCLLALYREPDTEIKPDAIDAKVPRLHVALRAFHSLGAPQLSLPALIEGSAWLKDPELEAIVTSVPSKTELMAGIDEIKETMVKLEEAFMAQEKSRRVVDRLIVAERHNARTEGEHTAVTYVAPSERVYTQDEKDLLDAGVDLERIITRDEGGEHKNNTYELVQVGGNAPSMSAAYCRRRAEAFGKAGDTEQEQFWIGQADKYERGVGAATAPPSTPANPNPYSQPLATHATAEPPQAVSTGLIDIVLMTAKTAEGLSKIDFELLEQALEEAGVKMETASIKLVLNKQPEMLYTPLREAQQKRVSPQPGGSPG